MYKVNVWEVKVCPLLRGISYCVLHSWCPVSEVLLWYKGKGNVHMVLSETTVSCNLNVWVEREREGERESII